MTIEETIKKLLQIEQLYGKDIQVYLDCHMCGKSFVPTSIIAQAVHIRIGEEKIGK